MSEPKPTVVSCGPFRLRVYYDGKGGFRAEISGCYQSEAFDTELKAKRHLAKEGLSILKPLVDELEKIHEKGKSRS